MKAVPTPSSPRVLAGYLRLALRSIRDHGARDILRDLWSELVFDWRNGVDTLVPREIATQGVSPSVLSDAIRYQGVSPRLFRDLLDHLSPDISTTVATAPPRPCLSPDLDLAGAPP